VHAGNRRGRKDGRLAEFKTGHRPQQVYPVFEEKPACFLCWLYCPEGVVRANIPVEIDLDYCKGCGVCAEECPSKAITMVREGATDE